MMSKYFISAMAVVLITPMIISNKLDIHMWEFYIVALAMASMFYLGAMDQQRTSKHSRTEVKK